MWSGWLQLTILRSRITMTKEVDTDGVSMIIWLKGSEGLVSHCSPAFYFRVDVLEPVVTPTQSHGSRFVQDRDTGQSPGGRGQLQRMTESNQMPMHIELRQIWDLVLANRVSFSIAADGKWHVMERTTTDWAMPSLEKLDANSTDELEAQVQIYIILNAGVVLPRSSCVTLLGLSPGTRSGKTRWYVGGSGTWRHLTGHTMVTTESTKDGTLWQDQENLLGSGSE